MKRSLFITIFLYSAMAFGQACVASNTQSCTPNVQLALPFVNAPNWNVPLVQNFTLLDQLLSGNANLSALKFVNGTISGNITFSGNLTVNNLDNLIYVGGSKYPCGPAGLTSAIADSVAAGGGVVDARGCTGSFVGASWTIGATSAPVTLLLGPSSWAMGSNIITLANGSKIIGLGHQSTTLTWTGDVDGIITPTGTTGGNVVVQGLSLVSGGLASATHAVVHLDDCPYCQVDDVFVSFDSSAASAGIRVEAVTANSGYGTWSGAITRSTVQRTSANQGTRATSGQIDIDFKGNSGVTNGNISRWMLWGNHLEGGTIDFQIFCGSANQLTGGDMFSGAPSVNITGNSPCNSNDNYIATELNGVSIAGSKAFAIDAFSNFNTIAGDISQNLVAPTDAGSGNIKWYSTNTIGAGVYSLPQLSINNLLISNTAPTISSGFGTSPSIVQQNGTAAFEINVGTGGAATSGVIGLPTATNGWTCTAVDMNTNIVTRETAFTTTSVTLTAASAWTASDKLLMQCGAF